MDGSHILSKEGPTQGENTAMAMYAIGTALLDKVQEDTNEDEMMEIWFGDDSTVNGKLQGLKRVGGTALIRTYLSMVITQSHQKLESF